MDVDFGCVQCGRCCHDLKLMLSLGEARDWLSRGHEVQLLCEAIPWPAEPPADDAPALHKRRRSFAVTSGSLPTRVIVTLVASFGGACPNLQSDLRCGIYLVRPRVCRIYPAEINPFVVLNPAGKACPPQAWEAPGQALLRGGLLVDEATRRLVQQSREADESEAGDKALLCRALGVRAAGLSNEGFAVHAPGAAALRRALDHLSRPATAALAGPDDWTVVSNRRTTLDDLRASGARGLRSGPVGAHRFDYLGFYAED